MESGSSPYFQTDFMPFSPFVDSRLRDKIFASEDDLSSSGEHYDAFVPLDLSVKSPEIPIKTGLGPDESLVKKRKYEDSESEEENESKKRQTSFTETKFFNQYPNQFGPLNIVPPNPNPYMNPDLLSPLSIPPVPTPYMSLYNIGSPPAPPTVVPPSSSSYLNLTPPQTPQASSFPGFLPFQVSQEQKPITQAQIPDMPSYPPHVAMQYYYNPHNSLQMNQMQRSSSVTKTPSPSPPPENADNQPMMMKIRKILPKPSTSPSSMGSSPTLQKTPVLSEQTMTISNQGVNQTIHIRPLLPSPSTSTPPTSMYSHSSQSQALSAAIPPPLMPVYPTQQYPAYHHLPFPSNPYPMLAQQFIQKPEPMSQALSFLFEKSLGSVRRWRENGITIQIFYCTVCQCPTDSEERLRTHIETFHRDLSSLSPSPSGVYQCKECDQICADEASLARHKLIHVTTGSPKERCKGCGRGFSNQESLANHEKDCSLYRPYR